MAFGLKKTSLQSSFLFYNLEIKDILRIDIFEFSLFTSYTVHDREFALSLDFGVEKLHDLVSKLAGHFDPEQLDIMIDQLTDPDFKYRVIEWDAPIGNITCKAELRVIQTNENEYYIPFIVSEII